MWPRAWLAAPEPALPPAGHVHALDGFQGFCDGQLAFNFLAFQLCRQGLDLGVLPRGRLEHFVADGLLGQLDCADLFLLSQFQALVQLLLEFAVAHLLEDVGVAGLVDLEGFVAVWADDVVNCWLSSLFLAPITYQNLEMVLLASAPESLF